MKYAHKYDPAKDTLPPFWHKDFFKLALERLDTSRMSSLDIALYENALIRHRTVEQHNDKKLKAAIDVAVKQARKEVAEKVTKEVAEKVTKEVAEKIRKEATEKTIESVKKLLKRGKVTIEEIAEDIEVSIDFVKEIQKTMNLS
jgi:predicted hydrocarbon binding protein